MTATITAFVIAVCLAAWSYPVIGSAPPPPHPTPRYIAEHPAQFSIWEAHAAVETLKARRAGDLSGRVS